MTPRNQPERLSYNSDSINHDPVFGKNVIETLSEGMYDNPLFLFREYVQNAADAIDSAEAINILKKGDAQIEITIDTTARSICFEDNGTGIRQAEVSKMLANIGDSQKDRRKDKGFRGIGRLGGLGYCQIVRFETSAKGENVKTMLEWDAKTLHDILADKDIHMQAGQLIKRITKISTNKCPQDSHFFRVSLLDVNENSGELLDIDDIRRYLSMVAPVPFDYARFPFSKDIEEFLRIHQLPKPCEYQIFLNGDEIRKGYETPLKIAGEKDVDILGIECKTIEIDGRIMGWFWFCVSRFDGNLPKRCWQRCIRLRKGNIQIGEPDCLSNHPRRGIPLWKEDRGNNYFMGEVHALDENLIPNSRRDYFNQDPTCRRFEQALTVAFKDLYELYRDASILRSEAKKLQRANDARKTFETRDRAGEYLSPKVRDEEITKVEQLEAEGKKAQKRLERIYDKASDGALGKVAVEYIPEVQRTLDSTPTKPFVPKEEPAKGFAEDNIEPETMKILKTVFKVLDKVLPSESANMVRQAIIRRFIGK